MEGAPSAVTVEAVLGDVLALEYRAKELRDIVADSPALAMNIMGELNQRGRDFQRMIISMS